MSGAAGGGAGGSGPGSTPKDALVMQSILKDMGVTEYEPRVIPQLLDFAYSYVHDVLREAQVLHLLLVYGLFFVLEV